MPGNSFTSIKQQATSMTVVMTAITNHMSLDFKTALRGLNNLVG